MPPYEKVYFNLIVILRLSGHKVKRLRVIVFCVVFFYQKRCNARYRSYKGGCDPI